MAEFDRFLNGVLEEKLLNLHTAAPCRVVSFDIGRKRASVQPLYMAKEIGKPPVTRPIIEEVPVLSHRYTEIEYYGSAEAGEPVQEREVEKVRTPIYKAGDVVLVAFSERALEAPILSGKVSYPAHRRRHSLTDAVILGVIL